MKQKSYRCLVVDDEALARELIETHLQQLSDFALVASCPSAIEARQYLSQNDVDLLFLDIEMPVLKGTDFYQGLRNKPPVIFTTAYRDYAVDGFDLEAIDYLLKPVVFPRFLQAIERFLARQNETAAIVDTPAAGGVDHLFVRCDRKDVRLNLEEILYIQSLKDYLRIYTVGGTYMVKDTMTSFSQRLSAGFLRVHRSYLVNLQRITAITAHDIEIGEHEIPIGQTYRDRIDRQLLRKRSE